MYAEDYGDLALARSEYAELGSNAESCLTCPHQACANACPHGLAIPELTRRAHRAIQA
jgi:predicted aldo/keto reductase-like oxidoreductase